MELILAIVVASTVIFFGALISMGNERQRKAIDGLREQVVLWAIQDLHIKREKLAREARVDDPIRWLTEVSEKVTGRNLDLHVVEMFDEPQAILCQTYNSDTTIIFSPRSPREIRRLMSAGKGKLDSLSSHPLHQSSILRVVHEMSVLNAGILFDIELALVWKALTKQEICATDRLWMYIQGGLK
jgi:hypothetical protein